MAIDTAEKRRSAAGTKRFGSPSVTPNASKDQEWRQQAAWIYSGILAGGLAALNMSGSPAADAATVLGGRLRVTPAEAIRPVAPLALLQPEEHRRLIALRANAGVPKDGTEGMQAPFQAKSYTVALLPDAALWDGSMIYVSDETGGATLAYSDGASWRRLRDNAVVS